MRSSKSGPTPDQRARRPLVHKELASSTLPRRIARAAEAPSGCHILPNKPDALGYVRLTVIGVPCLQSKSVMAHRVAWSLANEADIPAGKVVDHLCFNSTCVNPAHLQLTDHEMNMQRRAGANRNSQSGHRGVHWSAKSGRWAGVVQHGGRNHRAGFHDTVELAAAAVAAKREELFGHDGHTPTREMLAPSLSIT